MSPPVEIRSGLILGAQEVVEPRAPERPFEAVRQAGVVAEQHAFDDRATLPREAGRRGTAKPAPETVRDPSEPAAPPHELPFVDAQHDVNALTSEPGALVEAVLRTARRLYHGEDADACSLGRRAAKAQLELHAFRAEAGELALVVR